MPKSYSSISLLLLLGFLASACTSLKVPDDPVLVEISPRKAFAVWTVTDKSQYVDDFNLLDGKTYWDLRPTLVLLPPKTWKDIKVFIIDSCKMLDTCQKDIAKWQKKIDSIDEQLNKK